MNSIGKIFSIVLFSLLSCRSTAQQGGVTDCCSETSKVYSRKSILKDFASTLKSLAPDYQGVDKKGFYVDKNCRLIGAFVYDLSDTLNRETTLDECIEFIEGHVYHFAPIRQRVSYSSIAILTNGKIKIFKAVNCPRKGDRLDDAIIYVEKSEIKDKEALLNRIRDYRKYGAYIKVDEQSEFVCE